MRQVRLLPVVIFAALALLLFKGIGLITSGGYVLNGPVAIAAEGAATTESAAAIPADPTAADTSPTLADTSPTLPTKADAAGGEGGGHGEAAAPAEGAAPAKGGGHGGASTSSEGAAPAEGASSAAAADCLYTPPAPTPMPSEGAGAEGGGGGEHASSAASSEAQPGCPSSEPALNEHGDALPLQRDASGKIVPLTSEGDNSEQALLQRLAARRAELDKQAADLDMRAALLDAAEKKLDERTKQLEALQAQVAALVDEKQAAEDAGFKSIVSMYETMKPKDAAKIFDTLDLGVMLKVARAMSPRKMAPVLAAMSALPAEQLTTALATVEPQTTVPADGENLAALPQIVGK